MDSLWGEPTSSDKLDALRDWLTYVSAPDWLWFAKRLSGNDTGATGSHQVGPYLPHELALTFAPELAAKTKNPRRSVAWDLASHEQRKGDVQLIYYNTRLIEPGGTRDEFRLTSFGGRSSAMQDVDNTGALVLMAFRLGTSDVSAWVAETAEEEEVIEATVGPVEPGLGVMRLIGGAGVPSFVVPLPADCRPAITTLPAAWSKGYPTGKELTAEAVTRRPGKGDSPDKRLVARYECEYGLFQVVETSLTMPRIATGFPSVDAFVALAQEVANRRKSRAGRSLELHLATVFDEEKVVYERNKTTEGKRKPDFLFPSQAAYRAGAQPLHMLGVKTTVKDRWRQVVTEAAKIADKHLFTLTEGVSEDQFKEMEEEKVQLVVPASNIDSFPKSVRPKLLTLDGFITLVR
jgi:hypothetical protein